MKSTNKVYEKISKYQNKICSTKIRARKLPKSKVFHIFAHKFFLLKYNICMRMRIETDGKVFSVSVKNWDLWNWITKPFFNLWNKDIF